MANTLAQRGAQSATFTVPFIEGEEGDYNGTLTVTDWATLPKGKLRDLVNVTHASITAFFTEAAAAGLSVNLLGVFGDAMEGSSGAQWALDGEGYPTLTCTGSTANWLYRIQTSYSASE